MRLTVRVKPGSSRTWVGGAWGDQRHLVVAVTARAVDGAANEAVVAAVAEQFGVRAREVTIVSGHRSRTKVLDLDVEESEASARLRDLLDP